jgi:hypothetical protein
MAKVIQVQLVSGSTHLTCWVEAKVGCGNIITLKNSDEPERLWSVKAIDSGPVELDSVNRGWNNNI